MKKYSVSLLLICAVCFAFKSVYLVRPAKKPAGMVLINAKSKSFLMGWTADEAGTQWACFVGKHKVSFTYNFYMDTTLVTQQDYLNLMKVNPSVHQTGNLNLPVDRITWYDAVLYCNARSKRDKLDSVYIYKAIVKHGDTIVNLTDFSFNIHKNGYRLPTNAEYEYTERADKPGTYFFSETADNVTALAEPYVWYEHNSGKVSQPVAAKKPNPWGVYDLVGNLFEWCNDWEGPYSTADQVDPIGPPDGKTECGTFFIGSEKKVAKGGSYKTDVQGHMRISYHFKWPPATLTGEIGFRCVATKTK